MKSKTSAILLVDDSEDDLALLRIAFRTVKIPNPIFCVKGGREAIAYLNGEGRFAERTDYPYPHLILTDLNMPRGDGFTLLEDLKAHPGWAVVPTIVFSASDDADDIKKSFMLGANSYIVKPAGLPELRHAVTLLYEYWNLVMTPEADDSGKQLHTLSFGKLGERFPEPDSYGDRRSSRPPVKSPASGPVQDPGRADELLAARLAARDLAIQAAKLKAARDAARKQDFQDLKNQVARCRQLAGELQKAAYEIEVQVTRSRKLLKKQSKQIISQPSRDVPDL